MINLLSVFFGGALGATCRYLANLIVIKYLGQAFFATFFVNILGCFLIGIIFALGLKFNAPQSLKLFLTMGFLGGLTTFSTFCQDSFIFLKEGKIIYFLLYAFLSFFLGLIAFYTGYQLFNILNK